MHPVGSAGLGWRVRTELPGERVDMIDCLLVQTAQEDAWEWVKLAAGVQECEDHCLLAIARDCLGDTLLAIMLWCDQTIKRAALDALTDGLIYSDHLLCFV